MLLVHQRASIFEGWAQRDSYTLYTPTPWPTRTWEVSRFPLGSQIHLTDGFPLPFPHLNPCFWNSYTVATDLMPRDNMASEPRHWMAFGQMVMPVQSDVC